MAIYKCKSFFQNVGSAIYEISPLPDLVSTYSHQKKAITIFMRDGLKSYGDIKTQAATATGYAAFAAGKIGGAWGAYSSGLLNKAGNGSKFVGNFLSENSGAVVKLFKTPLGMVIGGIGGLYLTHKAYSERRKYLDLHTELKNRHQFNSAEVVTKNKEYRVAMAKAAAYAFPLFLFGTIVVTNQFKK